MFFVPLQDEALVSTTEYPYVPTTVRLHIIYIMIVNCLCIAYYYAHALLGTAQQKNGKGRSGRCLLYPLHCRHMVSIIIYTADRCVHCKISNGYLSCTLYEVFGYADIITIMAQQNVKVIV